MSNPEPYNPAFPITFTADGDKTREAIAKHIMEHIREYTLMYGLDLKKLDADAFNKTFNEHLKIFNEHLDSANPHPNMDINNTVGDLPTDRVVGLLTLIKAEIDNIPEVPNASTERRGIIELATNAEAAAGADTERAITPAHLKQSAAKLEEKLKISRKYYSAVHDPVRVAQSTWTPLVSVPISLPSQAFYFVKARLIDGRDETLHIRIYDTGDDSVIAATSVGWSKAGSVEVVMLGPGGKMDISGSSRTIELQARGDSETWGIDVKEISMQVWVV
jgi:hypothetical protein